MPTSSLHGGDVFARLGWASCALDWNHDGVSDLAVSAPTRGWPLNWQPAADGDAGEDSPLWYSYYFYRGAVAVYFGAAGAGLPVGAGAAAPAPDVLILTGTNESFTGSTLRCADVE